MSWSNTPYPRWADGLSCVDAASTITKLDDVTLSGNCVTINAKTVSLSPNTTIKAKGSPNVIRFSHPDKYALQKEYPAKEWGGAIAWAADTKQLLVADAATDKWIEVASANISTGEDKCGSGSSSIPGGCDERNPSRIPAGEVLNLMGSKEINLVAPHTVFSTRIRAPAEQNLVRFNFESLAALQRHSPVTWSGAIGIAPDATGQKRLYIADGNESKWVPLALQSEGGGGSIGGTVNINNVTGLTDTITKVNSDLRLLGSRLDILDFKINGGSIGGIGGGAKLPISSVENLRGELDAVLAKVNLLESRPGLGGNAAPISQISGLQTALDTLTFANQNAASDIINIKNRLATLERGGTSGPLPAPKDGKVTLDGDLVVNGNIISTIGDVIVAKGGSWSPPPKNVIPVDMIDGLKTRLETLEARLSGGGGGGGSYLPLSGGIITGNLTVTGKITSKTDIVIEKDQAYINAPNTALKRRIDALETLLTNLLNQLREPDE